MTIMCKECMKVLEWKEKQWEDERAALIKEHEEERDLLLELAQQEIDKANNYKPRK